MPKTKKQLKAEQMQEILTGLRRQLPPGAVVYAIQHRTTYQLLAAPADMPGTVTDITYRVSRAAGYRITSTNRIATTGTGYNKLGSIVCDLARVLHGASATLWYERL